VAFVKDTSVDTYCPENGDREAWCLDRDRYTPLPPFGQAPSHPLMYQPDSIDDETKSSLVAALVALNASEDGRQILANILNAPSVIEVDTASHLGDYGSLIEHVPGITAYLDEKFSSE